MGPSPIAGDLAFGTNDKITERLRGGTNTISSQTQRTIDDGSAAGTSAKEVARGTELTASFVDKLNEILKILTKFICKHCNMKKEVKDEIEDSAKLIEQ